MSTAAPVLPTPSGEAVNPQDEEFYASYVLLSLTYMLPKRL